MAKGDGKKDSACCGCGLGRLATSALLSLRRRGRRDVLVHPGGAGEEDLDGEGDGLASRRGRQQRQPLEAAFSQMAVEDEDEDDEARDTAATGTLAGAEGAGGGDCTSMPK